MISKLGIRIGIAAALCALGGMPVVANAGTTGGPITAHLLSMTVKSVNQTTNSASQQKFDRTTGNVKDVFQACVESSPTKTQGVYLFLDCSDLNHNTIAAIDTNPLFATNVPVGEINFDLDNIVVSTTGGIVKSSTVPVTVEISCNAGALVTEVSGIMDLQYTALGANPSCPSSGSVKITGSGTSNLTGLIPPTFIIDNGSSITVKKRSGSIVVFPPQ
jgi:hypothetical protein